LYFFGGEGEKKHAAKKRSAMCAPSDRMEKGTKTGSAKAWCTLFCLKEGSMNTSNEGGKKTKGKLKGQRRGHLGFLGTISEERGSTQRGKGGGIGKDKKRQKKLTGFGS